MALQTGKIVHFPTFLREISTTKKKRSFTQIFPFRNREGSLKVGDQILAIDREMLDGDICHKRAIEILQSAHGHIELVVAKGKADRGSKSAQVDHLGTSIPIEKSLQDLHLSSSSMSGAGALGESKNERELNDFFQNEPHLEKFSQIELIELVNEGRGLGFGILGGKSTGVVVKTVIPGGVSDKVCISQLAK